jgi:hypothetical protein
MKGIGNEYRKRRKEYKHTKKCIRLPIQCFSGIAPVVTLHYITLHCIAFHGSKVSQNNCRMWNMSYKCKNICAVQLTFSHKKTQENIVVIHEVIQNTSTHIFTHTAILSTHAIYIAFKWTSNFLGNKYSSTE